jgi:cytochrome c553
MKTPHLRDTTFALLLAIVPSMLPSTAAGADRGDAAKAEPIVNSVCAACHGTDGNSPIPVNPSLAGQHPSYIYKQLTDYKAGRRKNAVMSTMVSNLSEADMRNLAAYFAAQKLKPGTAQDRTLAATGQKVYRGGISDSGVPACAGCHSPNGAGIPAQFPRLAGQHRDYTMAQLQSFRSGTRDNDADAMMRTIASRLSDQEIAALSDYLAGLR